MKGKVNLTLPTIGFVAVVLLGRQDTLYRAEVHNFGRRIRSRDRLIAAEPDRR